MYNSQEIAQRIKLHAKNKGISVNQLLLSCGLGKNTVSKMSNGTDILSLNLAKIADYLDCSVDYLLGRTEQIISEQQKNVPAENEDKQKQTLIDNYDKLNTEGQEKLIDYSDDLVLSQKYIKNNQNSMGKEA